jgi:hypothetical protein
LAAIPRTTLKRSAAERFKKFRRWWRDRTSEQRREADVGGLRKSLSLRSAGF